MQSLYASSEYPDHYLILPCRLKAFIRLYLLRWLYFFSTDITSINPTAYLHDAIVWLQLPEFLFIFLYYLNFENRNWVKQLL